MLQLSVHPLYVETARQHRRDCGWGERYEREVRVFFEQAVLRSYVSPLLDRLKERGETTQTLADAIHVAETTVWGWKNFSDGPLPGGRAPVPGLSILLLLPAAGLETDEVGFPASHQAVREGITEAVRRVRQEFLKEGCEPLSRETFACLYFACATADWAEAVRSGSRLRLDSVAERMTGLIRAEWPEAPPAKVPGIARAVEAWAAPYSLFYTAMPHDWRFSL
jgi:hypothetical protein